jgi:hypothetical protein
MAKGVLLGSTHYHMELYIYKGPDSQYLGYLKWGHICEWCPTPQIFYYNYCIESYLSIQYQCTLEAYSPLAGVYCKYF